MAIQKLNLRTEKVVLDKFFFGADAAVSQQVMQDLAAVHRDQTLGMGTFYEELSPVFGSMLLSIRAWLLKSQHAEKGTVSVDVPATWWDHLKDDFLGSGVKWKVWLAQRLAPPQYAVKTKEYEKTIRVCPHNNTYFPESSKHIEYLLWRDDDGMETRA